MFVPPFVRVGLVAIAALVLHAAVFSQLRILGVAPETFLLLVSAAALLGEPERASILGIVFGLFNDLLLGTPFGMSALSLAAVGYLVARVQFPLSRHSWWIPVGVVGLATAASMAMYLLLGWIFGQESLFGASLVLPVVVASLLNAIVAWPAFRLMCWALDDGPTDRRLPSPGRSVLGRAR